MGVCSRRDEVIPFRRRQFETNAMLAEIFIRRDLCTDADLRPADEAEGEPPLWRLHVLDRVSSATFGSKVATSSQLRRHASSGKTKHVTMIWSAATGGDINATLV